jgi:hypothetical protein
VLRGLFAGFLRSIRRKRTWPTLNGDISSWILKLHGIEKINPDGSLQMRFQRAIGAASVHMMDKLLGPGMDWRKMSAFLSEAERISDSMVSKMLLAQRDGTTHLFKPLFSGACQQLMDALEVPASIFQQFEFSAEETVKMNRAWLATLTCMALYGEHAVVLISRAYKRDRRAVLDLVRADNLFMHDASCVDVIKHAELQDDYRFLMKLKNAVGRVSLRRRDAMHFYCYVLMALEQLGVSIPTHEEVRNAIDPCGLEYESSGAFERDFGRRRCDLLKMLGEAIPVRWPESESETKFSDTLQGLA